MAAPEDKGGGVLEIAPQQPPSAPPAPAAAAPPKENVPDQQNADDQGTNNDVELYRTYTDSDHASGHYGPLPYLGVSVHSTAVMQPNGVQQNALEVLSVDQGSPAAAAGIKGTGEATRLGASSLTASAMLGPAQELLAPLLKKTGQLGRQGDLIVAVDDDRVGSEQELAGELSRLKPGDTVWLTVLRESPKGQPRAVKVPIRLAPPHSAASTSAAN
ncbi:MAG TPA: PDZ domain-containing protein [Candidatus Binataceae bacterium]